MEFSIKKFEELSTIELFEIYRLRTSVFVVEQQCPYQEVDSADLVSVHIMMYDNDMLCGYMRVIPAGAVFENVSLGRVISTNRRKGNGTILLHKGIETALSYFHTETIEIEAQVYAREFYEKAGFVCNSDEFDEDGIPHIRMIFRKL